MKKPYLMEIIKRQTKKIIIWAEDRNEAIKATEELYDKSEINMADSPCSREIFCQFRAQDYDFKIFEQYNRNS